MRNSGFGNSFFANAVLVGAIMFGSTARANANPGISSPQEGSFPYTRTAKWFVTEWRVSNSSYSGSPFDLEARVTFRHESGETRATDMFFDGGGTWAFRFIPTQEGRWEFTTQSADSDLNGHSGVVEVSPAPAGTTGFLVAQGDKYVWEGQGDRAIVPHYVMTADTAQKIGKPGRIEQAIETFIKGHGFNGLHVSMFCSWFNPNTDVCTGMTNATEPSLEALRALEAALFKARAAGALVHIWAWGDSQHNRNPANFIKLNQGADRRLQRTIAARLGAIPNWSMGYGYDLWEWVGEAELRNWHDYMQAKMGWRHLLGARSELNQLTQLTESVSYSGYEQHKPNYQTYVASILKRPNKPTFSEDRFRVAQKNGFAYKDYTFDETRRGLWHSALSGGVAGIWGHLNGQIVDISYPYPEQTAQQIKTYSRFIEPRFLQSMERCNSLVPGGVAQYPTLGARDERGAVVEAATWVRKSRPEYFHNGATRWDAYKMMTEVINILRSNGWNARRTLANASRPASDPYRWGSDALVIGRDTIYDIYVTWPYPADPHAGFHGNQAGEVTSDLIAIGSGGAGVGDPSTGVCMKSGQDRFVVYREAASSVVVDLSSMSGAQPVIAVDTKRPYEELQLGLAQPGAFSWNAPYASDWAVSVGKFDTGTVSGGWSDLGENVVRRLYRAILFRDADEGGAKHFTGVFKRADLNGVAEVAGSLASSAEFRGYYGSLSAEDTVRKLYRSLLDRDPDPSGEGYFLPRVRAGEIVQVVQAIVSSPEFTAKLSYYHGPSDEQSLSRALVDQLYRRVLLRKDGPDYPGAQGFVDFLRSRQMGGSFEVVRAIFESEEYTARIAGKSAVEQVAQWYRQILGREVDPQGLAVYAELVRAGQSQAALEALLTSQEFEDNVLRKNAE